MINSRRYFHASSPFQHVLTNVPLPTFPCSHRSTNLSRSGTLWDFKLYERQLPSRGGPIQSPESPVRRTDLQFAGSFDPLRARFAPRAFIFRILGWISSANFLAPPSEARLVSPLRGETSREAGQGRHAIVVPFQFVVASQSGADGQLTPS